MKAVRFSRPVRKANPDDHIFRARRAPMVVAKRVSIGNKPHGTYLTQQAGFVILPDGAFSTDGRLRR